MTRYTVTITYDSYNDFSVWLLIGKIKSFLKKGGTTPTITFTKKDLLTIEVEPTRRPYDNANTTSQI